VVLCITAVTVVTAVARALLLPALLGVLSPALSIHPIASVRVLTLVVFLVILRLALVVAVA
jgi:hypothetical protein